MNISKATYVKDTDDEAVKAAVLDKFTGLGSLSKSIGLIPLIRGKIHQVTLTFLLETSVQSLLTLHYIKAFLFFPTCSFSTRCGVEMAEEGSGGGRDGAEQEEKEKAGHEQS
ncbi:hypothetical protein Bca52824_017869 [Brassica carinata]|uniref:Uncharacterized protein n=1 Tax=Brassica carinata TaxID=52824 RepID=A0A8X7VPA7_BRACI|nr:hypothetical protein Bca52824_017869 [Brassica carinata]